MMEYEGEWVQGIREGHGVRSYPNGEAYEGDFTAGVRHGHGRYSFTNKDVYAGEWVDDRRTGHGTYFYANGDVFVGERHSVINGPCRGKPSRKPRCAASRICSAGPVQPVPPSGYKPADDCLLCICAHLDAPDRQLHQRPQGGTWDAVHDGAPAQVHSRVRAQPAQVSDVERTGPPGVDCLKVQGAWVLCPKCGR